MGTLEDRSTGRRITLGMRCLIGRASHCGLRLESTLVSGEHASLRWREGSWLLRDLASVNGTMVDGVAVPAGDEVRVVAGAALSFGSRDNCWTLADESAPVVVARRADGGERVAMEGGILTLPDPGSPEAQVFVAEDGAWTLERGGERSHAHDQQVLELADGPWVLELPERQEGIATTYTAPDAGSRTFADVTLVLGVSHDGDDVGLRLESGSWRFDLGVRVYNEMLLTLARARLGDRTEHAELDAAEHGWLYVDELCKRANVRDDGQLNQYVFHARKQLARAGIEGSARLVDRGRPNRLRLGTDRVVIESR
jgi:hypothetical protein